MAVTESFNPIDRLEVLADGSIQVREATSVLRDGLPDPSFPPSYNRYILSPGDDTTKSDPRIGALAQAVWTPEVLAAYAAKRDAGVTALGGTPGPRVPEQVTDVQLFEQLVATGDITRDEAVAWTQTILPQRLVDAIAQLPTETQWSATLKARGQSFFLRHSPITEMLGQLLSKSSDDLDAIWIAAAQL